MSTISPSEIRKGIKLETAATGSPAPLHPGAIRFYKEQGLIN